MKPKFKRIFTIIQIFLFAALIYHLALGLVCFYGVHDVYSPNSRYADTKPLFLPLRLDAGFDTSYTFNEKYDGMVFIRTIFKNLGESFWGDSISKHVQIPIDWKIFEEYRLISEDTSQEDIYWFSRRDSGETFANITEFAVLPGRNYSIKIHINKTADKLNLANPALSIERLNPGPESRIFVSSLLWEGAQGFMIKSLAIFLMFIASIILKRKTIKTR